MLKAVLLLPLFWIALHVLGLSRLQSLLARTSTGARRSELHDVPASVGILVAAAGNHVPFPASCLTRSLLLNWLLRRRGVLSEFRIGVRVVDGRLDAHAWVECDGHPVNDSHDISKRYAAFEGSLASESLSPP